jgi:hypothetical protein
MTVFAQSDFVRAGNNPMCVAPEQRCPILDYCDDALALAEKTVRFALLSFLRNELF